MSVGSSSKTTNARRWTALFESGTTPWVMEDDHTYVCQIMGPMAADWARANALLIAAAPDLLEALKALTCLSVNGKQLCFRSHNGIPMGMSKKQERLAKAALKKASETEPFPS